LARKSRKQIDTEIDTVKKTKIFSVGVYARLSVSDKKKQCDSIETQQAIINAFVSERDDLRIVDIYIDSGISGQSFERPAFQRMIADMESGKIDCCITKDLSRLGRNAIDTGYYIEHFFPTNNMRYIAINDDYDSINAHSGGITIALKNLINENYALESARKIKASKQMIIRNGGFAGGIPPYGYIKHPNDCRTLIKDDDAAEVIALVFRLYVDGNTIKAIQSSLNQNGIFPPIKYFQSKGIIDTANRKPCDFWHFGVVSSLLRNRIYCGDNVQGKTSSVNRVKRNLPEEEWVITENTHEAIIDRKTYNRVQDMLLEQKKKYAKKPDKYLSPPTENIFKGKIICGKCGYGMNRERRNETIYFIRCKASYSISSSICSDTMIRERHFMDAVFSILMKQVEVLTEQAKCIDSDFPVISSTSEIKNLQAEVNKNNLFLKGLYESLITNIITDDEYSEMKKIYETKLVSLSEQEVQVREKQRLHIENSIRYENASTHLSRLSCADDLTAEVVDALIKEIIIYDDKKFEIKFRFTDEVVKFGGDCNE